MLLAENKVEININHDNELINRLFSNEYFLGRMEGFIDGLYHKGDSEALSYKNELKGILRFLNESKA